MVLNLTQKKKNIEDYFRDSEASYEQVLSLVPELSNNQCLIFCGAIPKGRGHPGSDIDVVILGGGDDRPDFSVTSSTFSEETIRLETNHILNVCHITSGTLDEMGSRVRSLAEGVLGASDNFSFQQFNSHEIEIMNWVFSGAPLENPEVFAQWQVTLSSALLPLYMFSYHALRARQTMDDARSFLSKGNAENALWTMRVSAQHLSVALLGSVGEVEVNSKWYLSTLRENADELGRAAVDLLVEFMQRWPDENPKQAIDAYSAFFTEQMSRAQEGNEIIAPMLQKVFDEMC